MKQNREIKFRAWDKRQKFMYQWEDIGDLKLIMMDENTTIMQFTGLKDKNGVEIFEGDWCRAQFRDKKGIQVIQGQIIMDEFMWCIDCTGCVGNDIFSINRPHSFERIGNIYENPELVKK